MWCTIDYRVARHLSVHFSPNALLGSSIVDSVGRVSGDTGLTRLSRREGDAVADSSIGWGTPAHVEALQEAAAGGDSDAMFNLGVLAIERNPPNTGSARRWYAQAAALGNVRAMVNLGSLFAERVEPPDFVSAQLWWERAAAGGVIAAMFNLGVLFAEQHDPPDLAAARRWWERAAAGGEARAMFMLGVLSARLDPPDLAAARYWHQQLVALEHPAAGRLLELIQRQER